MIQRCFSFFSHDDGENLVGFSQQAGKSCNSKRHYTLTSIVVFIGLSSGETGIMSNCFCLKVGLPNKKAFARSNLPD